MAGREAHAAGTPLAIAADEDGKVDGAPLVELLQPHARRQARRVVEEDVDRRQARRRVRLHKAEAVGVAHRDDGAAAAPAAHLAAVGSRCTAAAAASAAIRPSAAAAASSLPCRRRRALHVKTTNPGGSANAAGTEAVACWVESAAAAFILIPCAHGSCSILRANLAPFRLPYGFDSSVDESSAKGARARCG